MRRLVAAVVVGWLTVLPAAAEPVAREQVPEALRPWTDWVMHGHEEAFCSLLQGSTDHRQCAWPSRLTLDLDARAGRFTQDWLVQRAGWVPLPGDAARAPLDVRADGKPSAVTFRSGVPSIRLERGTHAVSGVFEWDSLPELLPIPADTGLVSLALNGKPVAFPNRDPQGQLWLQRRTLASTEESRLEVVVHRRVIDDIPLQLVTRVELKVAGPGREMLLGRALPDGFVPLSLVSPLPSRLEPDGRLRVQVRPGTWGLELAARHEGPASALTLPASEGPWDAEEVWVFDARTDLRLVSVEGVPAVDPQQTELPAEWRQLPAYTLAPGSTMQLVEKRRGDAEPAPDRLSLQRTWWLDFDGGGFTVKDQISGTTSRSWRLEMAEPTVLGRAAVDGREQFLTRLGERSSAGIELREGRLQLDADSRVEGAASRVPAVGWDHDFHEVSGQLNLPPGWQLYYASGVDDVSSSWVTNWTLLDLFVVLIVAQAVGRLWSRRWGLVALVTLALTYPESAAPRWLWLAVLAGDALVRALPEGRPLRYAKLSRLGALVALVMIALGFAADQVRVGLHPQLATPSPAARLSTVTGGAAPAAPATKAEVSGEAMVLEFEAREKAPRQALGYAGEAKSLRGLRLTDADRYNAYRLDPNAIIPTGPGVPRWSWQTIRLGWRGPVERDQQLHLTLASPRVNRVLAFVRVALTGLLLACVAGGALRSGGPLPLPASAARALVLVVVVLGHAARARADFPSPEMLGELRNRLLERPECVPECASSPRLRLEVTRGALSARMEVDAATETAVPLPGSARHWSPTRVLLDGQPAQGLWRAPDGILWLETAAGIHQVLLEGPLPDVDRVEMPLPLRPRRVEARAEGWTVEGLREDGLADDNLEIVRVGERTESARDGLQPAALPPFVLVERSLSLGLSPQADTRVVRVTPPGSAVVLEVPLVPGESVATPEVRVQGGKALVSMGPQVSEVSWHSILEQPTSLALRAPEAVSWTEIWRLDASPIWHVEVQGIPVVHRPAEASPRLREWHPWPGEGVTITIVRPGAVPGPTLTVDQAVLETRPGLRARDTTLTLEIRSSRGGQHPLTLPEGAELQSVSINGTTRPIPQEKRVVTLPLAPGTQTVALTWREKTAMTMALASSELALGVPSVNVETHIAMPVDRWTLFVGGARLGPAVLFWPLLVVVAVAAVALGRLRLTPLGARHWFLLGVGLTQVPLYVAAIVAGWLLALGWRKERGGTLGDGGFDLLQLLLVFWTVLALHGLFAAIQQGLLGLPDMQITGNGSTAALLRWYHDRAGATLPRTWVVSVPLLIYRAAMLGWALWIAWAVLWWLRWGWACFSEGGRWRRVHLGRRWRRPVPTPPVAPGAGV